MGDSRALRPDQLHPEAAVHVEANQGEVRLDDVPLDVVDRHRPNRAEQLPVMRMSMEKWYAMRRPLTVSFARTRP